MHKDTTMKHGSHHLHDAMLTLRHEISEHFHSRHFWVGVVATLCWRGTLPSSIRRFRIRPMGYNP